MTRTTCDPSPDPYLFTEIAKGNGEVICTIHSTWDGVSTPTSLGGCNGAIFDLRVRNTGTTTTWYAKVPRAAGGVQTFPIAPGADSTFTAAQLATRGITTANDVNDIEVTDVP